MIPVSRVLSALRIRRWFTPGVSVCLGSGDLQAYIREPFAAGRHWAFAIDNVADPEALGAALSELARKCGCGRRQLDVVLEPPLDVVLEPPLVDVRRLTLPRMRRRDLLHVLSRDVRRYFIGSASDRVVDASYAAPGRSSPADVVAAAVPATTLVTIRAAAEAAGWQLRSIAPAHAAWAAHGRRRGRAGTLLIDFGSYLESVSWRGDRIRDVRRSFGTEMPTGSISARDRGPMAARSAGRATALEFVDPMMRRSRASRDIQKTFRVLACAALIGCLLVSSWTLRTRSELADLKRERARIGNEIEQASTLVEQRWAEWARTSVIDSVAASTPRRTAILADLAALLPPDAHLEAVHIAGDTVRAGVLAADPGAVLQSISRPALITDAHLTSVGTSIEGDTGSRRFGLQYLVASDVVAEHDR